MMTSWERRVRWLLGGVGRGRDTGGDELVDHREQLHSESSCSGTALQIPSSLDGIRSRRDQLNNK